MPPRPNHNHRPLAGPETRAIPSATAYAHVGGATVLVLTYLALIPGFLPAFILAAVVGLVLLVPMLLIGLASCLLVLPISAVRRLARYRRHGSAPGAPQREESRPDAGAAVARSRTLRGQDAELCNAMDKQIQEIRSLPEILPRPPLST
jgi:hypothetical protein